MPPDVRDAGFGEKVRSALNARHRWLLEQDLAKEQDGSVVYAKI